jgi:hypothetical protein
LDAVHCDLSPNSSLKLRSPTRREALILHDVLHATENRYISPVAPFSISHITSQELKFYSEYFSPLKWTKILIQSYEDDFKDETMVLSTGGCCN